MLNRSYKSNQYFAVIIVFLAALLIFSRLLTLQHNMDLHPDEPLFYNASDSLKSFLAGSSENYTVEKEYPEGAIVFELPFHMLGSVLNRLVGINLNLRIRSRVASVAYFALGTVFGACILYEFASRYKRTLVIYELLMIFSVVHIEQSRYGTGDAISFCLIMAIVLTALCYLKKEKRICILLSFFLTGTLTAVKYPLVYFSLIPFSALLLNRKNKAVREAAPGILFLVIGFLCFSPKTVSDPSYIIRAIQRETAMYLSGGSVAEAGGFWNHLFSLTVYSTLYSGLLFEPCLAVLGIRRCLKRENEKKKTDILLLCVIPVLSGIFFVYNLFTATVFMRTFYPFFFLTNLYSACELAEWTEDRTALKVLSCGLMLVMIIRGGFYLYLLTENRGPSRLEELTDPYVNEELEYTTLLLPGYFVTTDYNAYQTASYKRLEDGFASTDDELLLVPGELVVTGTEDFSRCNHYFFPIPQKNSTSRHAKYLVENWDEYKKVNQDYYVGMVYPRYIYYLYGYWIKGTTGTDYEFPSNQVYYRQR